ncbi:MAG: hypothetical protein RLZZ428_637, partial [Pseudomonadota bacterium]
MRRRSRKSSMNPIALQEMESERFLESWVLKIILDLGGHNDFFQSHGFRED